MPIADLDDNDDLLVYRNLNLGISGSVIKNSPGVLYGIQFYADVAAVRFFKLYNLATAPLATSTVFMTIPANNTNPALVLFPKGLRFSAGLGIRATQGLADNDASAPLANSCYGNVWFT